MNKSLIIIVYIFCSHLSYGRGPALPSVNITDIEEKICKYKNLLEQPNVDLIPLIEIFENMYNTNQISNYETKKSVYCILKKFYLTDDPSFAIEFAKSTPDIECNKKGT